MRIAYALALAASLSISGAALAETAVLREHVLVKTADGRKVGFVDRVFKNAAGEPVSVQIIYNGRLVVIPANTLTGADKGFVTSLTAKEVRKL